MFKAPCPSCGGELQFQSKTSILVVCSYCRSNVVRHDINLELIGKQSELLPDLSPLQIGSSGKYKKKNFTIIGRLVMDWKDGRWNEWYINFQDGSDGWIAEAQGEFIIMHSDDKNHIPALDKLQSLDSMLIKSFKYTVVDRKKVKCIGSEGELPFKVVEGTSSYVIDLSNFNNKFATIEVYGGGVEVNLLLGEYTDLKKLQVTGMRYLEGWIRP